MRSADINTVSDLMLAASVAAKAGDVDTLHRLLEISEGWMQSGPEAAAQAAMLEAFIELID